MSKTYAVYENRLLVRAGTVESLADLYRLLPLGLNVTAYLDGEKVIENGGVL